MSSKLILCAVLLSLVAAAPAGATIITVDDFTSNTLNSNWIQSTILNTGTTATYTFNTTTKDDWLTITMSGFQSSKFRHDVLLRSDYGLDVGETLMTDIASTGSYYPRAGLIIAAATGITARKDLMYITYQTTATPHVETWWFHSDGTWTSQTVTSIPRPTGLFIKRTDTHVYELGTYLDTTFTTHKTFTVTSGNLDPGAAIGYFAGFLGNYSTWYDNLRMDVIPEPSSLALLASGLVGLLAYAWRKRR